MSRRRPATSSATLLPPALARPWPPAALLDEAADGYLGDFTPAPDVLTWIRAAFLDDDGPLHNPEHAHLQQARLGVLWTNVPNRRHMIPIAATAEVPQPQGGGWRKARAELQLARWFGPTPLDFLITLCAPALAAYDDAGFCAVVEHELYHCGQARDDFGGPRFSRDTGRPIYALRGHDVEEFTGVVRRYGAVSASVRALVDAAARPPLVATAEIARACGVCAMKAA